MKTIVLIIAISFLGFQGCVKEKEIPLLGEKGNGVTIKGVVYSAKRNKPMAGRVELQNYKGGFGIPNISVVKEYQCDSTGVFEFNNVVILDNQPDNRSEVVHEIDVEVPDYHGGIKIVYLGKSYPGAPGHPNLDYIINDVKAVYEFEIWVY